MKGSSLIAVGALTLVAGFGGMIIAGPLNPPVGSVQGTYKTLGEVEPRVAINATNTPGDATSLFTISVPGSYYLTGDLIGATGKSGIKVLVDNVQIDLNGFRLRGVAGSLQGIEAAGRQHLLVSNGFVTAWGGDGVNISGGVGAQVRNLTVTDNGANGLAAGTRARLETITARANGGIGITANSNSLLTNCISTSNLHGFETGAHCLVSFCQAGNNTVNGFAGIGTGSVLTDCMSSSNGENGFDYSSSTRIERCQARFNAEHGIVVGSSSIVAENYCTQNGNGGNGAGIFLVSTVTRVTVHGNVLLSADQGIKVDGTANLITGNRCTLNSTNFAIASGNRVASIITLPTSGAISGNSGGSSISDPDANLAY